MKGNIIRNNQIVKWMPAHIITQYVCVSAMERWWLDQSFSAFSRAGAKTRKMFQNSVSIMSKTRLSCATENTVRGDASLLLQPASMIRVDCSFVPRREMGKQVKHTECIWLVYFSDILVYFMILRSNFNLILTSYTIWKRSSLVFDIIKSSWVWNFKEDDCALAFTKRAYIKRSLMQQDTRWLKR